MKIFFFLLICLKQHSHSYTIQNCFKQFVHAHHRFSTRLDITDLAKRDYHARWLTKSVSDCWLRVINVDSAYYLLAAAGSLPIMVVQLILKRVVGTGENHEFKKLWGDALLIFIILNTYRYSLIFQIYFLTYAYIISANTRADRATFFEDLGWKRRWNSDIDRYLEATRAHADLNISIDGENLIL